MPSGAPPAQDGLIQFGTRAGKGRTRVHQFAKVGGSRRKVARLESSASKKSRRLKSPHQEDVRQHWEQYKRLLVRRNPPLFSAITHPEVSWTQQRLRICRHIEAFTIRKDLTMVSPTALQFTHASPLGHCGVRFRADRCPDVGPDAWRCTSGWCTHWPAWIRVPRTDDGKSGRVY